MAINLNNLPDSFSPDDKENLEFILSLGGEMYQPVNTWLQLLTNDKAVKKLKKTSQGLLNIASSTLNKDDVLKEVEAINTKLTKMNHIWGFVSNASMNPINTSYHWNSQYP